MSGHEEFIDPVGYREERDPDTQYRELLEEIMLRGQEEVTSLKLEEDGETRPAKARYLDAYTMRFDLTNGLPLITERDLSKVFPKALGEIIGFMNGAHTLDELESYGMPRHWWEGQITDEMTDLLGIPHGDLGSASYGPNLVAFPDRNGEPFNQIKALVDQIRYMPNLRRHRATTWYPPESFRAPGYEQKVVITPCHGSRLHVRIRDNGEMVFKHFQDSGDVPVGVVNNMIQWASFSVMLAQATGYKAKEYIHIISDAHIYENQFEHVEELLDRAPKPFPKVLVSDQSPIDEDVPYDKSPSPDPRRDIFGFRPHHFKLEDYDAHPYFRVPTPQ
ncbi:MAG: thymidylate synthase [Candidatus Saccharimonadales bacterium]